MASITWDLSHSALRLRARAYDVPTSTGSRIRWEIPAGGYVYVGRASRWPTGVLGNPWAVGTPTPGGRLTPAGAVELYRLWVLGLPMPSWAPPPTTHRIAPASSDPRAAHLAALEELRRLDALSPVEVACPCNGAMRGEPCHARVICQMVNGTDPLPSSEELVRA